MALALVASLLPPRWTAWTGNLLQPVNWLGGWVTRRVAENAADAALAEDAESLTREEIQRLVAENRELARLARQQQLTLARLRQTVDDLTRIRGQLGDSHSEIIVASVLKHDTSASRESLDISAGSDGGIAAGDWVLAASEAADVAATGFERVERQFVIGRVADVLRTQSRVQLCTDPDFGPQPVFAGAVSNDGEPRLASQPCLLYGAGGGRCVVRNATRNYLAEGFTHVYVRPAGNLPLLLEVGALSDARSVPASGLHFDLTVRPPRPPAQISNVYVLSIRE